MPVNLETRPCLASTARLRRKFSLMSGPAHLGLAAALRQLLHSPLLGPASTALAALALATAALLPPPRLLHCSCYCCRCPFRGLGSVPLLALMAVLQTTVSIRNGVHPVERDMPP